MTHNELTLLDDLLNVEDGLSRWDIEFIDGLDQAWRDSELTGPRRTCLHRMAARVGLEAEEVGP